VLGAAVERAPDHPALLEQRGEIVVPESADPVPQADVGQLGILMLHADQQLDDLQRGAVGAVQQQLPVQGGPVEGLRGEDDHAAILPDTAVSS
jgi:hypothetical protein